MAAATVAHSLDGHQTEGVVDSTCWDANGDKATETCGDSRYDMSIPCATISRKA
jgi:hypothetical protein